MHKAQTSENEVQLNTENHIFSEQTHNGYLLLINVQSLLANRQKKIAITSMYTFDLFINTYAYLVVVLHFNINKTQSLVLN